MFGLGYVLVGAAFVTWWRVLFTGRQSATMHEAIRIGLAYSARSNAFLLLLTEVHPRLLDLPPQEIPADAPSMPGPEQMLEATAASRRGLMAGDGEPEVESGSGWAVGSLGGLRRGARAFARSAGSSDVKEFGVNAIVIPAGYDTGFHYHDDPGGALLRPQRRDRDRFNDETAAPARPGGTRAGRRARPSSGQERRRVRRGLPGRRRQGRLRRPRRARPGERLTRAQNSS